MVDGKVQKVWRTMVKSGSCPCALFRRFGMFKTPALLALALHAPLVLALADNEQKTIETRDSLWASFQTPDRLPTAATAKRMTAEGLKS
jgi:hypothetical protein